MLPAVLAPAGDEPEVPGAGVPFRSGARWNFGASGCPLRQYADLSSDRRAGRIAGVDVEPIPARRRAGPRRRAEGSVRGRSGRSGSDWRPYPPPAGGKDEAAGAPAPFGARRRGRLPSPSPRPASAGPRGGLPASRPSWTLQAAVRPGSRDCRTVPQTVIRSPARGVRPADRVPHPRACRSTSPRSSTMKVAVVEATETRPVLDSRKVVVTPRAPGPGLVTSDGWIFSRRAGNRAPADLPPATSRRGLCHCSRVRAPRTRSHRDVTLQCPLSGDCCARRRISLMRRAVSPAAASPRGRRVDERDRPSGRRPESRRAPSGRAAFPSHARPSRCVPAPCSATTLTV